MSGLPLHVVALTLYAAFAPLAALVSILLLESAHPLRRAGAFALGYVLALAVTGALGAVLFDRWVVPALAALVERLTPERSAAGTGGLALSVVMGLAMLAIAAWHWRRRTPHRTALPGWLAAAEQIGAGRAFGLGALLLLTNADNVLAFLAGVHLIGETEGGTAQAVPLTVLLVLVAAAPALVPPLIYLALPRQAGAVLGALRGWIGQASQVAVDLVLAALGGWLLLRGLGGLLLPR